jgi:hypothetical protein
MAAAAAAIHAYIGGWRNARLALAQGSTGEPVAALAVTGLNPA